MAWFLILQYLSSLLVFLVDAQPVMFEKNSTIPVKGSSLALSCKPSVPFTNAGIGFKIKDKDVFCDGATHICGFYDFGYNFTSNMTGAFVIISNLNRASAEGTWECEYDSQPSTRSLLNITVYTIPKGLAFSQYPNISIDLSITSVKLQCKTTSCMYPMASIQWFYQDQSNPAELVNFTTTNSSGTLESCQDPEWIFTSKLDLPLYSTISDNSDKTVTFSCRILYLDTSINIRATGQHTVRFAVRVTEAVLQQNNQNITDTLTVTLGELVTLACMTTVSRPTPTIDWYLGSQKKGSGASLNFIPIDEDHNKTIYCQAYNTDINRTVFSLKPNLIVQVRVTEAVLQQNKQNITDTLIVTSGESVNMTCVTTTSRPSPIIQWYLGSQKIGSGASMTFTPSDADHNKTIHCQAYNINPDQPVFSLKPRLFVQVKVFKITLANLDNGKFLFYEGFVQMLQCISSPSRPIASIRWWLGNSQLTQNITNTNHTDDSGLDVLTSLTSLILTRININQTIYCDGYISGQAAVNSSQHYINVFYQPDTPLVKEYGITFPWRENQTGIMQCNSSDFGNPRSTVRWIRNISATDTDGLLVIQRLVSSDNEQEVSCQLVNNYTVDKNVTVVSKTVALSVEYWPVITLNTSSTLTVNETQTISSVCSASGNPKPDPPIWREMPAESTLRFDNISRADTGTYTCVATANSSRHEKLESQKQLHIIVQYAPDVNVTIIGPTHHNMTLTVLCEARGLPTAYIFHSWKQIWGDKVIRSDLQGTPSSDYSTLKLERLSLQDMGTYICSVDNSIRGIDGNITQTGDVDINVTGRPAVLKEEEFHFTGNVGDSVSIFKPFYSNPAIESFIFKKNGTELQNSSRITMNLSNSITEYKLYGVPVELGVQLANLLIQNLTQDDFDDYTLVLENFWGAKEFRLQLEAAGPPLMVYIFNFNRFIENQIEFHFKRGFNGGRVQTFVIEFKSSASPDLPWRNSSVTDLKETQTPNGTYYVNVTQPPPGTYEYRMYSWNEIGRSPYSEVITLFIPEVLKPNPPGLNVAAISGGIGAAVLVITVVAIVIIVRKRRNKSNDTSIELNGRPEDVNYNECGLKDNPVYETSDQRFGPSTSKVTSVAEYAAVVKPKKKAAMMEDPSNLYAQVDKTELNGKKGAARQQGKTPRGDVYQNIDLGWKSTNADSECKNSSQARIETTYDENVYENPGGVVSNNHTVSKDGLLYADLMLDPPTFKNGKMVVYGIENRTEYADIAYGKRGEPLPDNDENNLHGDEQQNKDV